MRSVVVGLAFLVAGGATAVAQSNVPAPEIKELLDNVQIKVMEMRLKPGARTASDNRPNSFVYSLTDGTLVFVPPGRTPYEMSFRAGEALWLPAQATALANEGDKEIRALVVEIKEKPVGSGRSRGKPAAASGGAQPATAKGKKSSQTP